MAATGGNDHLQRNIVGNGYTITDVGVIISQRNNLVCFGTGSSAISGNVCVGLNATDGGFKDVILYGSGFTINSTDVLAIGSGTIGAGSEFSTMLGVTGIIDAGAVGATVIGFNAHVTGQAGLALGARSTAPAYHCVIGAPFEDWEIQVFQIASSIENPWFEAYLNIGVGREGLDLGLRLWDGLTLCQISCAAAPPVGARLLYVL